MQSLKLLTYFNRNQNDKVSNPKPKNSKTPDDMPKVIQGLFSHPVVYDLQIQDW